MTQQIINVGSAIGDGTGDAARVAFTHCNENFTELYQVSRPTGNAIEYQFNNTTTEPPSVGQIRFNQATQASTTKIWASHTTSSGINIKQFLAAATTGAKLVLQDKIDNTNYIKFDVTGAPVDKTTYWEFAVAVTASGGNLPNAAILAAVTAAAGGSGTSTVAAPQGRLTLQTGVPVMTTTQSAKTTIFYTPYTGAMVPLYSGSAFSMTPFTEVSVLTTDTTKSPAAIGVNKVNDWFVWNDAGTLRLSHGPDWATDTARASPIGRISGIWVNGAAITNGPPVNLGTYVGTTRSNASSQLDWIYGALATNGTAGFFGVWNAYNRVLCTSCTRDASGSWAYSTATWRAANGSSTMRCTMVRGLDEDGVYAQYGQTAAGNTIHVAIGVGLDTTSNFTGTPGAVLAGTSTYFALVATYNGHPGLGVHFCQAVEYASAATGNFLGNNGSVFVQNGLTTLFHA